MQILYVVLIVLITLPLVGFVLMVLSGWRRGAARREQQEEQADPNQALERIVGRELLIAWPIVAFVLFGIPVVALPLAGITGKTLQEILLDFSFWAPYGGFWVYIWLANRFGRHVKKTQIGKDRSSKKLQVMMIIGGIVILTPIWIVPVMAIFPSAGSSVDGAGYELPFSPAGAVGCRYDRGHKDCTFSLGHDQGPQLVSTVENGYELTFKPLDEDTFRSLDTSGHAPCKELFPFNWYPRNDAPCGWILYTITTEREIGDVLGQEWGVVTLDDFGKVLKIKIQNPSRQNFLHVMTNTAWWTDCQERDRQGQSLIEICRNGNAVAYSSFKRAAAEGSTRIVLDIDTKRY